MASHHDPRDRRRRRRYDDDDDDLPLSRSVRPGESGGEDESDDLGLAWSSWPEAQHGPVPHPDWVITEASAIDTELGILKTGKEADVHLVERALPSGRSCLLAAKRYRDGTHRLFHRDAGYLEGRRVRRSRETRAMARRTDFGRDLLSGQWAAAEFGALSRLWQLSLTGGIQVPYPVQLSGTELMLEFIGESDGTAAPRLAQLRPPPNLLADYWLQAVEALGVLALAGYAHGDLSPFNVLVHGDRLVLIDLPQIVDVVGNPRGPAFLARDVRVMSSWFTGRGLDPELADPQRLTEQLLADAGVKPASAADPTGPAAGPSSLRIDL